MRVDPVISRAEAEEWQQKWFCFRHARLVNKLGKEKWLEMHAEAARGNKTSVEWKAYLNQMKEFLDKKELDGYKL